MKLVAGLTHEFRGLPRLMQIGLGVLAIGGALDIFYHASPAAWSDVISLYLGQDGYYAHLITLAGMLITLVGLFSSQIARMRHRSAER